MGVSIRAYARMRGCSESAVRKAIASKRITPEADGSIDPERANKQWEQNTFVGATLRPSAAATAATPRPQSRTAVPHVAGVESAAGEQPATPGFRVMPTPW